MMALVSLWQKICEYTGISEYEAKVYASLVKEDSATARRLSVLCGVPRMKIYKTLKNPIERGLVTEMPSEPKRFVVLPPSDTFRSFLESYQQKCRISII